jgi:hypothetical protein
MRALASSCGIGSDGICTGAAVRSVTTVCTLGACFGALALAWTPILLGPEGISRLADGSVAIGGRCV